MYVVTSICLCHITGRQVWVAREIPSEVFGDKWLSGFVIIRQHWFSRIAQLQLADSITTTRQRRLMQVAIKGMGFTSASGVRNGIKKTYRL